jgi:FtsP/CotA-like multicopper oxidase with cupredoxin domain/plastocyanin
VAVIVVASDDGSAGGGTAAAAPVTVTLSEFKITPGTIEVPEGGSLNVVNGGTMEHNLSVTDGPGTPNLAAGKSATLDLSTLPAGTYEVTCTIAGHAAAGMKATLVIGGAGSGGGAASGATAAAAPSGGADHGAFGDIDFQAMDAAMLDGVTNYLAAFKEHGTGVPTEGRGNQLLEPVANADGVKEIDLTASIVDWEVEPGKIVQAWSYNGQVPGPWIKVQPGDRVRVTLHNDTPMGQDIHWHGISTPFGQDGVAPITQPMIEPGQSYTYEFTAPQNHEMGMYHAHNGGAVSVVNGLYGQFQVGDVPLPDGKSVSGEQLPAKITVDKAMPMVLNDAGNIGLSLNGKSFPATDPIAVNPGETLQVTYHNEGLQCHPMHLHRVKQLVIEKDDWPLDQPYYVDTLTICPGERYTVLIRPTAEDVGIWAYHCHILTHAETDKGLAYMVTVLVVPPVPEQGQSAGAQTAT